MLRTNNTEKNAKQIRNKEARAKRKAEEGPGRSYKLQKKGWTLETFESAKENQEGRCAICGEKPEPYKAKTRYTEEITYEPLCADHEHTSPPKARGLLCSKCNPGIGCFRDDHDPKLCELAASYLRKWGKT
jgi:hypothetical protein